MRRRGSVDQSPRSGDRSTVRVSVLVGTQRRLLDLHEELDVVARLLQLVQQQLERLLGLQRGEDPAQLDDDGQLLRQSETYKVSLDSPISIVVLSPNFPD